MPTRTSPTASPIFPGTSASTQALDDADRQLLGARLRDLRRAVQDRGAPEQLLHGEPHPGNVLSTKAGPVFIDLETCCRGPVEFDLAHVPTAVSEHYPDADQALLDECRGLVLAVVAKHRCDPADQFPDGPRALRRLLRCAALRTAVASPRRRDGRLAARNEVRPAGYGRHSLC